MAASPGCRIRRAVVFHVIFIQVEVFVQIVQFLVESKRGRRQTHHHESPTQHLPQVANARCSLVQLIWYDTVALSGAVLARSCTASSPKLGGASKVLVAFRL